MEKTRTVQIGEKLYNDIADFCNLNNIKVKDYVNEILQKYFLIEKYGDTPFANVEKDVVFKKPLQDDMVTKIEIVESVVEKKDPIINTELVIKQPVEVKPESKKKVTRLNG